MQPTVQYDIWYHSPYVLQNYTQDKFHDIRVPLYNPPEREIMINERIISSLELALKLSNGIVVIETKESNFLYNQHLLFPFGYFFSF